MARSEDKRLVESAKRLPQRSRLILEKNKIY
jgi:hypothetical protein